MDIMVRRKFLWLIRRLIQDVYTNMMMGQCVFTGLVIPTMSLGKKHRA